jgi:aryl sulfotransferase
VRVTWIASYPKSGNTWVRFFLYNYLVGEVRDPADVGKRLPDGHIPSEVAAAEPIDGMLFVKTHYTWPIEPGPAESTNIKSLVDASEAVICIVRDPKDTMLSNLHYLKLVQPTSAERSKIDDRAYVNNYIAAGGDPYWRLRGFGTWAGHTRNWLAASNLRQLLLRYERLKADPAGEFRRVVEFIKAPMDETRFAKAIKASSFDNMRALEVRAKKANRDMISMFDGSASSTARGMLFMNKGKSGQTLAHIDPALDAKFDAVFARVSSEYGYGAAVELAKEVPSA